MQTSIPQPQPFSKKRILHLTKGQKITGNPQKSVSSSTTIFTL